MSDSGERGEEGSGTASSGAASADADSSGDASDADEPTATYTHRPGAAEGDAAGTAQPDAAGQPDAAAPADREFGRSGYVLLGVLFVAFVVAPLVVYLRPPQLGWRVTLIVFPLLPAVGLGVAAVWATLRPRTGRL